MLNSDVVEVVVSTVVDREVETQLVFPTVPKALQGGVPRKFVEEPVEAQVGVNAGRDVVGVCGSVVFLDGLLLAKALRTAERFCRELSSVRLDKYADGCDLGDVASTHLHNERSPEGDLYD